MTLMFWKFIGITVDVLLKLFVLPLLPSIYQWCHSYSLWLGRFANAHGQYIRFFQMLAEIYDDDDDDDDDDECTNATTQPRAHADS